MTTTNETYVRQYHPEAFESWHQGNGAKIYADRVRFIALSETKLTSEEAWADAARRLQDKHGFFAKE